MRQGSPLIPPLSGFSVALLSAPANKHPIRLSLPVEAFLFCPGESVHCPLRRTPVSGCPPGKAVLLIRVCSAQPGLDWGRRCWARARGIRKGPSRLSAPQTAGSQAGCQQEVGGTRLTIPPWGLRRLLASRARWKHIRFLLLCLLPRACVSPTSFNSALTELPASPTLFFFFIFHFFF